MKSPQRWDTQGCCVCAVYSLHSSPLAEHQNHVAICYEVNTTPNPEAEPGQTAQLQGATVGHDTPTHQQGLEMGTDAAWCLWGVKPVLTGGPLSPAQGCVPDVSGFGDASVAASPR